MTSKRAYHEQQDETIAQPLSCLGEVKVNFTGLDNHAELDRIGTSDVLC